MESLPQPVEVPLRHPGQQGVADFRKRIEVNLVGTFAVTRAFAPLPGTKPTLAGRKGRIVNISSVAGRTGPPLFGGCAPAKYGVEGLSESLRRELQAAGVDVVIIGPGSVATPIWDKLAGTTWQRPVQAFTSLMMKGGRKALPPERIGEVVRTALTVARPRARYAPVPGKLLNWTVPTRLPSRVVDRLIGAQLRLNQKRA